jgi:hypothetical protein
MVVNRVARVLIVGAFIATSTAQVADAALPLARDGAPVVLTGSQIGDLAGIAPGDLVGFRSTGSEWVQIPIQVDEVKVFNIRGAYPADMGACGGLCFTPANRVWWERVYADPNTLTGVEVDETVNVVSGPLCSGVDDGNLGELPLPCTMTNSSTLDADDEVVFMAKDAGVRSAADAPAGVAGTGVEIAIADPLDGGEGFVYLFERDANADEPLAQDAGTSYVTYDWVVNHIAAAHPGDPDATEKFYASEYRFNGASGAGNPETSFVETARYRREMAGRWTDNVLINKRGASPVNILDRHDASITTDNLSACTRNQVTFDGGEMAYLTSKAGPIRAIRAYLGTNSGPFVERRQIYYESSEFERIDLRVHAIPGPTEVWNFNENAAGMRYTTDIGSDRIDGQGVTPGGFVGMPGSGNNAGTYVAGPVVAPKTRRWQQVDRDTATDPDRGGLTFTVFYDSNNPDPFAHSLYRDSGLGGCKGGTANSSRYFGAILDQAPLVMNDTDTNTLALLHGGRVPPAGTQQTFLTIQRNLHYEATGAADGPGRLDEDQAPFEIVTAQR